MILGEFGLVSSHGKECELTLGLLGVRFAAMKGLTHFSIR